MKDLTLKQVASVYLQAQGIYENSWNGKAYTLTYGQAVTQALLNSNLPVVQTTVNFISLLLRNLWNDVMLWAEEVSK